MEEQRENKKQLVIQKANSFIDENKPIWAASQLTFWLNWENNDNLKDSFVRRVFKQDLGLKYKRIKKIQYLGNLDKDLVLR